MILPPKNQLNGSITQVPGGFDHSNWLDNRPLKKIPGRSLQTSTKERPFFRRNRHFYVSVEWHISTLLLPLGSLLWKEVLNFCNNLEREWTFKSLYFTSLHFNAHRPNSNDQMVKKWKQKQRLPSLNHWDLTKAGYLNNVWKVAFRVHFSTRNRPIGFSIDLTMT